MKIELTDAEALVLAEWLFRNSKKQELFDDQAEQYVMWNIECQLERELVYPTNTADAIVQARKAVKNTY